MMRSACTARAFHPARVVRAGLAAAILVMAAPAVAAPQRVVSINLCTDEMAMLIAAPGQLVSVSNLAADPVVSAMAEEARGYRLNSGLAEEVFLMKPDLVLAGSYTTRDTVNLLQRLGIAVAEFAPETGLADVRDNLERMGALLGQEARAEQIVADMDARLAALAAKPASNKTAALYFSNGYTSGADTLAGDIVAKAGLENIGPGAGVDGLGRLPLERLIMAAPDVIIGGDGGYEAPALADAVFAHPAFVRAAAAADYVPLASSYTICGGPFNVDAVERLEDIGND
ncbi:ABC transporter substrate-binding protein [Martelella endophytica]|nr:ABC transporter substrate-binding protein [Martelella endophytica]